MMTNKILIDYDIDYDTFIKKYLRILRRRLIQLTNNNWGKLGYVKSHSGKVHVVVMLPYMIPQVDAIVLAILLGSDFRRECLNYSRLIMSNDAESWFFNDYKTKGKDCGDKSLSPVGLKKFIQAKCPGLPELVVKYAKDKAN